MIEIIEKPFDDTVDTSFNPEVLEMESTIKSKNQTIDLQIKRIKSLERSLEKLSQELAGLQGIQSGKYLENVKILNKLEMPVNQWTLENSEMIEQFSIKKDTRIQCGIYAYLKRYGKLSSKQNAIMWSCVYPDKQKKRKNKLK